MSLRPSIPAAAAVAVALMPALSFAQWPLTPGSDLLLSDGDGEEIIAKLALSPDGGLWVSWYDSDPQGSPAFGYDVRIQRIGPDGNAAFPAGGLLVADRGFSSVQDYGLDVGPDGSAYLAFRDDRVSGVQVTAARVTADGAQPWGPLGVQVSNTTAFVGAPKVAVADDGQVVVGWSEDNAMRLARLDADGNPVWPSVLGLNPPSGSTFTLSSLVGLDGGSVAIAWVRQDGSFFSPRYLWAQRVSAGGAPQWAPAGVPLETSNSLQLGNFPQIQHDGSGGIVAAWYGTGPLQSYAAHVLSNGNHAFPGGKVELAVDPAHLRVSPSIAHDGATGESYCAWVETDQLQAQRGVYGQKLSSSGQRLWTDQGRVLQPLSSQDVSQVQAAHEGGGLRALWSSGNFGNEVLVGVDTDVAGAPIGGLLQLSDTPRSLDDVVAARDAFGALVFAWHDDRSGDYDLFAKCWTPSGALGPAPGAFAIQGAGNSLVLEGAVGALGASLELDCDLSAGGQPLAVAFAALGETALPLGGQTLLANVFGPGGEILGYPVALGPQAHWSLPLPANPALAGLGLTIQAAGVDAAANFTLSSGLDAQLGL